MQGLDYPLVETEQEYVVNAFSFQDYLRELQASCCLRCWPLKPKGIPTSKDPAEPAPIAVTGVLISVHVC